MTKILLAVIAAILVEGCAATYQGPTAINIGATERFTQSRAELFKAARRALVADGNQIMSADEASGTISTAARDFRLTPEMADCGTTMGLDYLKDNRTSGKLAWGLIIDDGRIEIRAQLQAEYKPGAVDQNITLTCRSRGTLENELAGRIRQLL